MNILDPLTKQAQRVNKEGMALVKAVTYPHLSHHTIDHENAFSIKAHHVIQITDTQENAMHIQYQGAKKLIINKIIITTDEPDTLQATILLKATEATGGNATQPCNLNGDSNNKLKGAFKDSNDGASPIVLAANGEKEFLQAFLKAQVFPWIFDTDDGIVLGINNTLLVKVLGTAASKVRIYLFAFEEQPLPQQ